MHVNYPSEEFIICIYQLIDGTCFDVSFVAGQEENYIKPQQRNDKNNKNQKKMKWNKQIIE